MYIGSVITFSISHLYMYKHFIPLFSLQIFSLLVYITDLHVVWYWPNKLVNLCSDWQIMWQSCTLHSRYWGIGFWEFQSFSNLVFLFYCFLCQNFLVQKKKPTIKLESLSGNKSCLKQKNLCVLLTFSQNHSGCCGSMQT